MQQTQQLYARPYLQTENFENTDADHDNLSNSRGHMLFLTSKRQNSIKSTCIVMLLTTKRQKINQSLAPFQLPLIACLRMTFIIHETTNYLFIFNYYEGEYHLQW